MHVHVFLDSLCTVGVSCHEVTSCHVHFWLVLVQLWFSHGLIFRAIAPFQLLRPIAPTVACVTFKVLDAHVNFGKVEFDAALSLRSMKKPLMHV